MNYATKTTILGGISISGIILNLLSLSKFNAPYLDKDRAYEFTKSVSEIQRKIKICQLLINPADCKNIAINLKSTFVCFITFFV